MYYDKLDIKPGYINIAYYLKDCQVLGPGNRFVIWVQGCNFSCPGCITPHMQDWTISHLMSVEELIAEVLKAEAIEGITFVGGEPFAQARELANFAQRLKEQRGLSIVTFSGYTLEELTHMQDPDAKRLLSATDILIDGRYEQKLAKDLLWRGSSNQEVHFFSSRYAHLKDMTLRKGAGMEFRIVSNSEIEIIGIPPPGFFPQPKAINGEQFQ